MLNLYYPKKQTDEDNTQNQETIKVIKKAEEVTNKWIIRGIEPKKPQEEEKKEEK